MGLTGSPCSVYQLASTAGRTGTLSKSAQTCWLYVLGAALPPDILSVDFYPLVEYCPHSLAGCSVKTLGRWSGGRPDLGPAFRQQSQKAPISFPLSVPLRKNSNSAFQQDDLTKNPAHNSFFFPLYRNFYSH